MMYRLEALKCLGSTVPPSHRGHLAEEAGRAAASLGFCSHVWIHSCAAEEATWLRIHSIKLLLQTHERTARAHSPRFVLLKLLAGQTAEDDLSSLSETRLG